jgi:hypothetical protein
MHRGLGQETRGNEQGSCARVGSPTAPHRDKGETMDETATRAKIQQHVDAVVRGDMDAAAADFSEDLRPHLPEIAGALPQPVVSAEVLSLEVGGEEAVATIRWTGETDVVTIRSHWREIGGHPLLVQAEPVD